MTAFEPVGSVGTGAGKAKERSMASYESENFDIGAEQKGNLAAFSTDVWTKPEGTVAKALIAAAEPAFVVVTDIFGSGAQSPEPPADPPRRTDAQRPAGTDVPKPPGDGNAADGDAAKALLDQAANKPAESANANGGAAKAIQDRAANQPLGALGDIVKALQDQLLGKSENETKGNIVKGIQNKAANMPPSGKN
jgi:hypothetical protein